MVRNGTSRKTRPDPDDARRSLVTALVLLAKRGGVGARVDEVGNVRIGSVPALQRVLVLAKRRHSVSATLCIDRESEARAGVRRIVSLKLPGQLS